MWNPNRMMSEYIVVLCICWNRINFLSFHTAEVLTVGSFCHSFVGAHFYIKCIVVGFFVSLEYFNSIYIYNKLCVVMFEGVQMNFFILSLFHCWVSLLHNLPCVCVFFSIYAFISYPICSFLCQHISFGCQLHPIYLWHAPYSVSLCLWWILVPLACISFNINSCDQMLQQNMMMTHTRQSINKILWTKYIYICDWPSACSLHDNKIWMRANAPRNNGVYW